ncbi:hypothetical protein BDA96_04G163800 [Sorghum bicolor]|uniref:Uncharacterized protein n=2 Tax=Sorghum bicolor TaxID=4558 RepID=A0A921R4K9_SORBI|nr:uncharacterized protein LOC8056078 [Sorghum bicolor]KAG0533105.1 hypothetical protein BDA96_04G163800 [Sorghum bicolor]KXG30266.1 hypothetical protein SORBI_3004G154100 [Sorghum bicolor]|eukprot:XP_021313866.1 uncharacterized protein LOC8056078 [Sorghum bicolor]
MPPSPLDKTLVLQMLRRRQFHSATCLPPGHLHRRAGWAWHARAAPSSCSSPSLGGLGNWASHARGAPRTQLNMGNIQWCPKFNNLTTLTISQWCLHPDFYSLIVVLQNSRSLENQTLKLRGVGHTHQRFTGELEERSFSCEHLDSIDIVCWEVQEHDPVLDNLVELLTENGIEHDEIDISISL